MRQALTLLFALCFTAATRAATLEGTIQLKYSEFGDDAFQKEFGDIVKATTKWYAGEFFGEETVYSGITVKNTGTKPMFFNYYVAFYDKDKKLVGAAGQGSFGGEGLAPGTETQMGSCLIHLPKDRYKDIVSFEAVIYETDQAPKKD